MLRNLPNNMNGIRSINLLIDAMLILLEESKFSEISITSLTKKAGVVRNTFYAHFETKEDLISYYMYSLFEKELNMTSKEIQLDELSILYFQIWHRNIAFLNILKSNQLLHLLNRLNEYLDRYCDEFLNGECYTSSLTAPYMNSIFTDVLASIVKNWMKQGHINTPEELNMVFHQFIKTP